MRFLINRSDAIGDLILTLPMARLIKEQYPSAELAFIVSHRNHELATLCPYIDRIFCLNPKQNAFSELIQCYRFFNEWNPDYYLHVGGSSYPGLIAFLKRTPFRGGLRNKWPGLLWLKHGVRQKRSLVLKHESEYNIELLRPIFNPSNIGFQKTDPLPLLQLETEVSAGFLSAWEEFLKSQLKTSKAYIVIHPGMTGHTLNWPIEHYTKWMLAMEKTYPQKYAFVLSYTPSDAIYIEKFKAQLNTLDPQFKSMVEFDGSKWGIKNYLALLAQAKLLIAPSTGPTHLANILKTPQIAIYSPVKVQSAKRWGPYFQNEGSRVLVPEVDCPGHFACLREKCQYYPCMPTISIELALHEAKELLQLKKE